jgi:hypothetical protein
MNNFRKLGLIDYNGGIEVHSSLLNVVLHDHPQIIEPSIGTQTRSIRSQPFLHLSLGFWSGKTRAQAWLLTFGVLFFLFANLGAALAVNRRYEFCGQSPDRKRLQ